MHVLVLPSYFPSPSRPLSGTFFLDNARAIARAGARVTVATLEARSLREFGLRGVMTSHWQDEMCIRDDVRIHARRGWNPMLARPWGGRIWSKLFRKYVDEVVAVVGKPDVVHAHNALWAGYAVRELGRALGSPVVLTEHDSVYFEGPRDWHLRFALEAWRAADRVAAVSAALARKVEGLAGREVTVLPNAVDTDFFTPGPGSDAKGFTFLSVANLVPVKGLDLLIDAFAGAFRSQSAVQLRIVGEGPERESLTARAARAGVDGRVVFLGALPREGVRNEMRRADAYVLSSHHETFGIALAEAMSCGLPVVATEAGGPQQIVSPSAGCLVPTGDATRLGQAMLMVFSRPSAFDRGAIRNSVVRRYGHEAIGGQMIAYYRDVLGSGENSR